ncbi:MAG: hypothetical protein OXR73_02775 [Myxococcales bacterium]|nr:hypothetical protein [Myxococcales bacterium]
MRRSEFTWQVSAWAALSLSLACRAAVAQPEEPHGNAGRDPGAQLDALHGPGGVSHQGSEAPVVLQPNRAFGHRPDAPSPCQGTESAVDASRCPGYSSTDETAGAEGADEEPPLPAGLDGHGVQSPSAAPGAEEPEPTLPAGLDAQPSAGLPTGRVARAPLAEEVGLPARSVWLPLRWRLRSDARIGARLREDPEERRVSIGEQRLQLDLEQTMVLWSTSVRLVVDAIADGLSRDHTPRLETGHGALDLRTASLSTSPGEAFDLRVGRQILTWGTGDLLFINDLFPKDWTAFLIGRDVDYLKAPSDAAKLSFFAHPLGLDLVLTPRFDADRLPSRSYLSSFEPTMGRIVGQGVPLNVDAPERWLQDGELAARLHVMLASWELSGYLYRGFWKVPAGLDRRSGRAIFPPLSVYGASARGPLLGGIVHVETGYYDSRADRSGDDPLVRNAEVRALCGYEHALWADATLSFQYYLEAMLEHAAYRAGLPAQVPAADALRHVATVRLRWLALRQRLRLSVFGFVSPSDRDGYVRISAAYDVDDHVSVLAGANLFAGTDDYTFFGQFMYNSNVYAGVRYSR